MQLSEIIMARLVEACATPDPTKPRLMSKGESILKHMGEFNKPENVKKRDKLSTDVGAELRRLRGVEESIDPKLAERISKLSAEEKVKQGWAHPDTLKKGAK